MNQGSENRRGSRCTSGADTDHWRQRTAFVGFDWAGDHHDVVRVDQYGKIVEGAGASSQIPQGIEMDTGSSTEVFPR